MSHVDSGPPLVTLIVPIRNERHHIRACLESIRSQTYPPHRLECLVVDGQSDDGTVDIVRRLMAEDARIALLENPLRTMPHGLNNGIQAARGSLIGVVSGHSVLPDTYVAELVDRLQSTGAWSVGGRIVRTATGPLHQAIARATGSRLGVGDSRHNYADRAQWVETAFPGFWRREVFDRVGAFDPAMTANEDNELSYRIRAAGGRIWYDPSIAVEYVPRGTLGGLFHQYRAYACGKVRVYRKHRGGLGWRHLVPGTWVAVLFLGVVTAPFAWLAAAGLALAVTTYVIVVSVVSLRLSGGGTSAWMVALALATMHLGYGIGTWQGLADWVRRRS